MSVIHGNPAYQIRAARFEELPQLAAIEQSAGMLFAGTEHGYLCSGPNLPLDIVLARWRTGFVFVAADSTDVVAGFALGGELDGHAFLQEIDVAPAHGRRGVGRRLLHAVLQWGRQCGYPSVVLSTFSDVPWNAPFYAKHGFQIVPAEGITAGMQQVREAERRAGIAVAKRVFMRADIVTDAVEATSRASHR